MEDDDIYFNVLTKHKNLVVSVCVLIEIEGIQWLETATCERGYSVRTHTKTVRDTAWVTLCWLLL